MNKLNILISYEYFTDSIYQLLKTRDKGTYNLMIDSGAFSAYTKNKEIKLDDYCKFLDSIEDLQPFTPIQLDVVRNEKQSFQNFEIMQKRGYDVVPVFTRGSSLSTLEELYTMSDYVMFGGTVGSAKVDNYIKKMLIYNKKRKAHLLGFTKTNFLKYFKPYSCDSSSWLSAVRFGNLNLYKGGGEVATYSKKKFASKPPKEVLKLFSKIGLREDAAYYLSRNNSWSGFYNGFNIFDSINKESHKGLAIAISILSNILRSVEIERNVGTMLYLALASNVQLDCIFRGYDYLIEKGKI